MEAVEHEVETLRRALADLRGRKTPTLPLGVAAPTTLGDEGFEALLQERQALRREVEDRLLARARSLAMPTAEAPRLARWLAAEPVRYEHHHLSAAFWVRSPALVTHVLLPCALLAYATQLPPLALLGPGLVWLFARHFGWSDVVLTSQRLVLEGAAFPVEGLQRVEVERTWNWPMSRRLELEYADGTKRRAKVRSFTRELQAELRMLDVQLHERWSLW